MDTIYQLEDFRSDGSPISLTIGNFDGVHLGHQAIFSKLKGRKVVFTFSNHPQEILKGRPFYSLTTLTHRLKLLEESGIDTTIVTPFTEEFSKQSAKAFLLSLRSHIPFTQLVLGHDATIGKDREGDAAYLAFLSKMFNFSVEYLDPITQDETLISSSTLRKVIQEGQLNQARLLLGRPYSILTTVEAGAQQGRHLGFKTANLKVHNLALPPLGVYVVRTTIEGKQHLGVANLGQAPTLHANRPPLLEVHLIDYEGDIYKRSLEVIFLKFLRHEKRFESIEALKRQIQEDVASARQCTLF